MKRSPLMEVPLYQSVPYVTFKKIYDFTQKSHLRQAIMNSATVRIIKGKAILIARG